MLSAFRAARSRASFQPALRASRPRCAAAPLAVRHASTAAPAAAAAAGDGEKKAGKLSSFLDRVLPKRKEAGEGFNRWLMVAPAVTTHLCLGSVYAWSILNEPLCREMGVVASSAGDWDMGSVVPVFSTIVALQGISAALLGVWQERVGSRASGSLGAAFFGGGFLIGAAGIATHTLPLLYLGYGLLGGIGIGLSYVPPVAELLRWFPDKRGLATGLTIMGYGGGALVAGPLSVACLSRFKRAPDYLGPADSVNLVTRDGRRFADVAGELKEVVVASSQDLTLATFDSLSPGVYVVGTGSTGAAATLATLGAVYFAAMAVSSFSYRSPRAGYKPPAAAGAADGAPAPPARTEAVTIREGENVTVSGALRTPQFWQIWTMFGCMTTAGMAVVSVAKTMMTEIFGSALPLIVTGAFASSYVLALSVGNLAGRVFWASLSDRIGRRKMFMIGTGLSIPLYLGLPAVIGYATAGAGAVPLAVFMGATVMAFSVYGSGFSATPPYEAEVFGAKYVGAIHGRMMTASSVAAMTGPFLITLQRDNAMQRAIRDLTALVDDRVFEGAFGGPKAALDDLVAAKTVSIDKLLALAPEGTADPTPFLYNDTMLTAAGLLSVAFVANGTMRRVNEKHYERREVTVEVLDDDAKKEDGEEEEEKEEKKEFAPEGATK